VGLRREAPSVHRSGFSRPFRPRGMRGLFSQGIGLRPQPWAGICRPVGPNRCLPNVERCKAPCEVVRADLPWCGCCHSPPVSSELSGRSEWPAAELLIRPLEASPRSSSGLRAHLSRSGGFPACATLDRETRQPRSPATAPRSQTNPRTAGPAGSSRRGTSPSGLQP